MSPRGTAFTVAAVCGAAFVAVMIWGLVIEQPRLGGNRICVGDVESAKLLGVDEPGVYKFDRTTGRPAHVPASMAIGMVMSSSVSSAYSGQAACGMRALVQTTDGVVALVSLLGIIISVLIGVFARSHSWPGSMPDSSS